MKKNLVPWDTRGWGTRAAVVRPLHGPVRTAVAPPRSYNKKKKMSSSQLKKASCKSTHTHAIKKSTRGFVSHISTSDLTFGALWLRRTCWTESSSSTSRGASAVSKSPQKMPIAKSCFNVFSVGRISLNVGEKLNIPFISFDKPNQSINQSINRSINR